MSSAQRRIDPSVASRLLKEPYRFHFFQAVRVLEHLLAHNGARKQDILSKRLRFNNTLSMSFPASEIEKLAAFSSTEAVANDPSEVSTVEITPAFMGMPGVQGVLPAGYTEKLSSRELYQRDPTARAFLDIFTNRAVALFYEAWKKYRLDIQYEMNDEKPSLQLLLALVGLASKNSLQGLSTTKGNVFEQSLAYYAGVFTEKPVAASTIERVLQEHFAVPVRVEQFVGAWYDIPEAQRSKLASANVQLGKSALLGAQVWQRDLRLRLWIGPIASSQFNQFLPGAEAAEALKKWVTLLTGLTLEYHIQLVLKKESIRQISLSGELGTRLGYDSYLCSEPSKQDRKGANYFINTIT